MFDCMECLSAVVGPRGGGLAGVAYKTLKCSRWQRYAIFYQPASVGYKKMNTIS